MSTRPNVNGVGSTTYDQFGTQRCHNQTGFKHYPKRIGTPEDPILTPTKIVRKRNFAENVSITNTYELLEPMTTDEFISRTRLLMPQFRSNYPYRRSAPTKSLTVASQGSTYRGHGSHHTYHCQQMKFKFQWGSEVEDHDKYPVSYHAFYQPYDDPDTIGEDESASLQYLRPIYWDGSGDESDKFEFSVANDMPDHKPGRVVLLKVDLDIVHPVTGELDEAKEDVNDGGYVSIKREVDGDDVVPVTQLKLHANSSLPSTAKFRLKFADGGRYKIYSDDTRQTLVQSEVTEFDVGSPTTLYFQGLEKSQSRGGEEITMQIGVGGNWYDGDSVKCTVVQSEFQIQVKAFIGYAWTKAETTDNPFYWPGIFDPIMFNRIAKGDNRNFRNVYSDRNTFSDAQFRVMQTVVITPFKDIHTQVDLQSERLGQVAPESVHHDVNAIPIAETGFDYGNLLPIGSGDSEPARLRSSLFETPLRGTITSWARLTLEADGIDGHIPGGIGWGINWRANIEVNCADPLEPKVYVDGTSTYVGVHDRYPFYEIICLKSDGDYIDVYRFSPASGELPGPDSLSNSNMVDISVNKSIP